MQYGSGTYSVVDGRAGFLAEIFAVFLGAVGAGDLLAGFFGVDWMDC